jgi:autotransporter-associated beta strand protein
MNSDGMKRRSRLLSAAIVGTSLMLGAASSFADVTHQFIALNGAWENPANWNTGVLPGGGPWQIAAITNGGTATLGSQAPNPDVGGTGELNEVWAGNDAGAGHLIIAPGANLHVWQWLSAGRTAFAASLAGSNGSSITIGDPGNAAAAATTVTTWQLEVGQSWLVDGFDTAQATNAHVDVGGNTTFNFANRMSIGCGDFSARTSVGAMADGTVTFKDNAIVNQLGFDGSDQVAVGMNGYNLTTPGSGNGNKGTLNLLDNAKMHIISGMRIGQFDGGRGIVNISGNATLTVDPNLENYGAVFSLGDWSFFAGNRTNGTVNQSGNSVVTIGNAVVQPGEVWIGGTGDGAYNLSGGTLNAWTRQGVTVGLQTHPNSGEVGIGTVTITGGTANLTGLTLGKFGNAKGTVNQSAGTVNVGLSVAGGDFTQNGTGLILGGIEATGTAAVDSADPASGTYNLSGGALNAAFVTVGDHGVGTLNISGSGALTAGGGVIVARTLSHEFDGGTRVASIGTVNLDGGTLTTSSLTGGTGTSTVHFNGGVLRASADSAAFVGGLTTVNLKAGGAKIHTNGFNVATAQSFTGVGGLVKQGAGKLQLNAPVAYAGGTTVEGGALDTAATVTNSLLTAAGGVNIKGGRVELQYTGTSPMPGIFTTLKNGFAVNFATGSIRSTTADTSHGLGYVDSGTAVTVAYTLYGDGNLDNTVGFADLVPLAQYYEGGPNKTWSQGDFNYDNNVNFADLVKLAQNYGMTALADGSTVLDPVVAGNFQADWALAQSLVPEPTTALAVFGVIGAALHRRRQQSTVADR